MNLANAIHDEAVNRGLDPTNFTPEALDAKSKMYGDFSSNKKGSTGQQVGSFNAFLGHAAGAQKATDALSKDTTLYQGVPALNTVIKTANKQLLDSPAWKAFQTSLIPVQTEINNFLAAGYKPSDDEGVQMRTILSDNETPARINAALKQLAETADIRLQSIGQRYLDTMGTTYSKLMSADSRASLKNFGIPSKADGLSQKLPQGWNNGQAQQLTDKAVVGMYLRAAGNDSVAAQELAKQNGWKF
jgi:hypothetical protein